MKTFEQLGISKHVIPSLQKMNFLKPTDIQKETIPFAIDGRDVLASAQTGTGKTGAFAIPLVSFIVDSNRSGLILTPTRELAAQVMEIIRDLIGANLKIKTALLIGGEPMNRQLKQLQNNPRIVVGTPGRINDHLKRGTLKISNTDFLVIDETDRMLDMGFSVQIDEIIRHMPKQKQTLMFSATLDKEIINLAKKYLNNPERVCLDSSISTKPNILQKFLRTSEDGKYDELKKQIDDIEGSIIVFVNTKYGADKLAKKITTDGYAAKAIHGGLRQDKRNSVIKNFREKKHRVMIATDVAARGLDIPHIQHVVNYDLPKSLDDYTHRIGRTGRAGSKGSSICFITPKEDKKSYPIRKAIDPTITPVSEPRDSRKNQGTGKKSSGEGFTSRKTGDGKSFSNFSSNRKPTDGNSERPFDRKKLGDGKSRNSFSSNRKTTDGNSERPFDRKKLGDMKRFSNFPSNRKPTDGNSERPFDRKKLGDGKSRNSFSSNRKPTDWNSERPFERKKTGDGKRFSNFSSKRKPTDGNSERPFERKKLGDGKSSNNFSSKRKPTASLG